jgi:hypothetical protein
MSPAKNTLSDEQLEQTLKRLDRFARLTDSQFRIPFTKFRFGLDSIIGLVPVVGETIGLVLSLYLVFEAFKLKMPPRLKLRMLRNVALDFLVGLVPVFGDIADIAFKANIRNMKLIKEYVEREQQSRHALPNASSKRPAFIILLLGLVLIAFSVYLLLVLSA